MMARIERRPVPGQPGAWPDSVHPVLRRVYAARGIASADEIDHRLGGLLPPQPLGGIGRACELLEAAIDDGARVVVVGDYDCDGATATAVAVRGLRLLGASDVDYAVPNRMRHGYGLSAAVVEELLARKPQLLITVDNGIAAHAGVAAARAHGMRVIVTDHHLPGATLPGADAIVNPNLPGDAFASKALAGVGVMFYLLLALRARLRERRTPANPDHAAADLACLLDLVALGTVADLVPLDRNNRILVEAGLRRMRAGRACAGIAALFACGKRDPAHAVAGDLGFVVGPRINAAGRLQDMRIGIECLLADGAEHADELAATLSAINVTRREMQADMLEQAQASVHRLMARHGNDAFAVGPVLYEPDWHPGVVGLVASKLKESLHRPVIACAPAAAGSDELKCSGRSITDFHLRDALAAIDARQPGLIAQFGGHAMAAGLSLSHGNLAAFAAAFDAVVRERIAAADLEAVLLSDGELDGEDFSVELARQLRYAGPWGQGFAEPMFDGEFEVAAWKVLGGTHLRLQLRHAHLDRPMSAIAFGAYTGVPPPARVRAAFALQIDEWHGVERVQLAVKHLEPA